MPTKTPNTPFDRAARNTSTSQNGSRGRPRLRLVRAASSKKAVTQRPKQPGDGEPIINPTDPRWVLAIRTAEQLQGPILEPQKRDRLIKLGKLMGLSAFDANLVIAIVQDQARRGYRPQDCPAAGEPQLRMIALPQRNEQTSVWITIMAASTMLAGELLLLLWVMH